MVDRKTLVRRLTLAAYFFVVFLIFLLFLFPFDLVKAKLESEFRARTPLELTVGRISPRFFNRFALSDVLVSDKKGKVLFESKSASAGVSLFSLLRGNLSVSLKADAYGGELRVKARQGTSKQYLRLDADGLDIASYPMLKDLGLHLAGKLGGNFEMDGDSGTCRLALNGLTSRGLKIKGLPIPDLDFEKGWLETDVKGDRLTVKKLELEGKDLAINAKGDLVLRESGTINVIIKFKPSERLSQEQSGLISLFKNRDADGFYQVNLGGVLSAPMPRF